MGVVVNDGPVLLALGPTPWEEDDEWCSGRGGGGGGGRGRTDEINLVLFERQKFLILESG